MAVEVLPSSAPEHQKELEPPLRLPLNRRMMAIFVVVVAVVGAPFAGRALSSDTSSSNNSGSTPGGPTVVLERSAKETGWVPQPGLPDGYWQDRSNAADELVYDPTCIRVGPC